jgi:predicted dehydrogenase
VSRYMPGTGQVRWGIIGTARIARKAFVPAVSAAGGAVTTVAGRELARASQYAAETGIGRAVQGYQALVDDPDVDALYVPLPNGLHAEWTMRALRAGKAVLCEKPLCGSLAETEQVLAVARETGTPLWEAFVFPFHEQMAKIRGLLASGAIGDLREIQSNFHFVLDEPGDFRLHRGMDGGALNDVGCYPVRLAVELLRGELESAWATATLGGDGVDVDLQGSVGYSGHQRLTVSCGFERSDDRFARLLGTAGQIHITDPFHPGPDDSFTLFEEGKEARGYSSTDEVPSFTGAVRHIQRVVRGQEEPQHLAVDNSLPTAQALDALREAAARDQVTGDQPSGGQPSGGERSGGQPG